MHAAWANAGLTASVTGSGQDVVLVHGSLGDYRQWQAVVEQLRTRYRVIALSRRFHWPNAAPSPGARYSYETHRDDLLHYLHALGRPVHLVGHSYGAGVALLAALRDPLHVQTLVLIEPALHSFLSEGPGVDADVASRNAMLATVQAQAAAGHDEQAARVLADWLQGGPGGFDRLPPAVRSGLLENARTVGPTFAHATPEVTCEDLRELRAPALVLNGERTRIYYRVIGEHLASCLAAGRHATIDDAAHMAIVERPVETASFISSFLAGLPASG